MCSEYIGGSRFTNFDIFVKLKICKKNSNFENFDKNSIKMELIAKTQINYYSAYRNRIYKIKDDLQRMQSL